MEEEIQPPPTRAEHIRAGEKIADELGFGGEMAREFARAYAAARAQERHSARVRYVRGILLSIIPDEVREEAPEVAAEFAAILAHLTLFGQGGPRDAGGPMAASQLPILPVDRRFRWRRRCGGAWVAAIREIAARTELAIVIDDRGVHAEATVRSDRGEGRHWLATVDREGRVTWGFWGRELHEELARALVATEWVTGEAHDTHVVREVDGRRTSVDPHTAGAVRRVVARRIVPSSD